MPFPVNIVIDTFSGGNANPIGAPWSHDTHLEATAAQVLTGQLTGSTSDYWDALYATSHGPSAENYITVATADGSAIILRVKTTNIANGGNNYHIFINGSTWEIDVMTAGSTVTLGATFTQAISSGDSIGISYDSVTGNIDAWYKAAAGSWTSLATRNDTTYQNQSGQPTVESFGTVQRFDDFGGGTVGVATLVQSHFRWRNDDGGLQAP